METLKRIVIQGSLPVLVLAAGGTAASSATINPALFGAWTASASDCSRLFERTSRGLSFKQPADKFAQAAIIRAGEVQGPSSVCRVVNVARKREAISVATECRDSIGYLSQTVTIKVQSAHEIIYSATGDNVLNVTYQKCPI